jgi:hypothetical protein
MITPFVFADESILMDFARRPISLSYARKGTEGFFLCHKQYSLSMCASAIRFFY